MCNALDDNYFTCPECGFKFDIDACNFSNVNIKCPKCDNILNDVEDELLKNLFLIRTKKIFDIILSNKSITSKEIKSIMNKHQSVWKYKIYQTENLIKIGVFFIMHNKYKLFTITNVGDLEISDIKQI